MRTISWSTLPLLLISWAPAVGAETPTCHPPLSGIRFDGAVNTAVSKRLKELFDADQAARSQGFEKIDWSLVGGADMVRRVEVLDFLQKGQITQPEDLFYAALIFQHGDCPAHYELTRDLAERSMKGGFDRARWLYAAAVDRYLMNTDQPQKYGTQFQKGADGKWELYRIDPSVTDEERQKYDVRPLAEARKRAEEMNRQHP